MSERAGYGPAEYAPGYQGWRATLVLVFLVLLNVINFIDRQLLQSFVVDVRRDLELSYFQFSLLTGLFFSFSYTLAGVFMGALADRMGRPKLIAIGLTVWSALTAVSGLAQSFVQLATARAFVALGESSLSPSALSMIADIYPERRHGLASGVYYLGIPLGAGGSLLVAGLLGPIIGWRGCFLLLGGLGVAIAAFVLLLRDPPRRTRANSAPMPPLRQAVPDLLRLLKRSPSLRYLLIAATAVIFSQGALVLDQAWLVEERGYEVAQAQTIFGLLFLLSGVIGAILGGQLSDLFHERAPGGRMTFLAVAFLVVAPISIAYRFMEPGTPLFYTAAVVGSIAIMLPFGPIISSAADLSPARSRATVIAITILVMALFGTAAGNAFAGWLSDYFISQGVEQPLTWALLLSGGASLLGVPAFLLAAWRYRESRDAAAALDQEEAA
jgi:MFS family permease